MAIRTSHLLIERSFLTESLSLTGEMIAVMATLDLAIVLFICDSAHAAIVAPTGVETL